MKTQVIYRQNETSKGKIRLAVSWHESPPCVKLSDSKGEFIVPRNHVFTLQEWQAKKDAEETVKNSEYIASKLELIKKHNAGGKIPARTKEKLIKLGAIK